MFRRVILVLLAVAASAGCSVRSLKGTATSDTPGKSIAVGLSPQCLALADFNRDGKIDVAVGNGGSANLTILLGDGRGGFNQAEGSPFDAGNSPNDLAAGDVNGDGKLDLAVANHDTTYVTILAGNGFGQFKAISAITVKSRPHPHGIAFGDFNGDRQLDFVVDDWGNNQVTVVFGDGKGNFASPGLSFAVGQMPYQRVRAADLNKDGLADVITTNTESGDVTVLLANGKGGFAPAPGSPFKANRNPFGVAVGDLDGDGKLDLAIVNFSGHGIDTTKDAITILMAAGDGRFTAAAGSPFKSGASPVSVAIGDVDGDGVNDVAAANMSGGSVTVLLGGKNGLRAAPGSPVPVGKDPEFVAIGDLNGDGKGDLVVAEPEMNAVRIILSE